MKKNMTFHKRKIWVVLLCCILMMTGLIGRLVYLMCFRSDYYYKKAKYIWLLCHLLKFQMLLLHQ